MSDETTYTQTGGDRSPADHGGAFTRTNEDGSIEIFEIQPVLPHSSEGEAIEVGFTFWTKEGYFDAEDLEWSDDIESAAKLWGMTREDFEELPPVGRVEVAFSCGLGSDEGPAGFGSDLPDYMREAACSWGGKLGADLDQADEEFRDMVKEAERLAEMRLHRALAAKGGVA